LGISLIIIDFLAIILEPETLGRASNPQKSRINT